MRHHIPTALVVDDSRIMRIVSVAILERLGFLTATAADGDEALVMIAHTRFSIILMDCDMPRMSGYETTEAIRQLENGRQALIITVTASGDRGLAMLSGMDDFIEKPLTSKTLERVLKCWGWTPVHSKADVREVIASLQVHKQELVEQTRKLALQNEELEKLRQSMQPDLVHDDRNVQQLRKREQLLKSREQSLKTRELFLARRERSTLTLDQNESLDEAV